MAISFKGMSKLGVVFQTTLGVRGDVSDGKLQVMTWKKETIKTPQPIHLCDEDGNVENDGDINVNVGLTRVNDYMWTVIGGDGDRLWFADHEDGIILELSQDDYSIIGTYSAPDVTTSVGGANAKAGVAISSNHDFVYWALRKNNTGNPTKIYKLNIADMSVALVHDIYNGGADIRCYPAGMSVDDNFVWMCSSLFGGADIRLFKFDLNLNPISETDFRDIDPVIFNFGTHAPVSIDSTGEKLRVIRGDFTAAVPKTVFIVDIATMKVEDMFDLNLPEDERLRSIVKRN